MKKFIAVLSTVFLTATIVIGSVSVSYQVNSQTLMKQQSQSLRVNPAGQTPRTKPSFQVPFNTRCAAGFNKVGENVRPLVNGMKRWTDWFVCSTPVIYCPKQMQDNGLYSTVAASAILQLIGDPDSPSVSFRVQYKCDYGQSFLPTG